MPRLKPMFVYILASHSRRLYIGVTDNLLRRVREHRAGSGSGQTSRYRIHRLVYYEECDSPTAAIARETQLKKWNREKKLRLIESSNLGWLDLAADWTPTFTGGAAAAPSQPYAVIPSDRPRSGRERGTR